MAYLREIGNKCEQGACNRRIEVAVFNDRNAPVGRFCRRHGEAKVREMNRERDRDHGVPTGKAD